jgi:hypothetical protein
MALWRIPFGSACRNDALEKRHFPTLMACLSSVDLPQLESPTMTWITRAKLQREPSQFPVLIAAGINRN